MRSPLCFALAGLTEVSSCSVTQCSPKLSGGSLLHRASLTPHASAGSLPQAACCVYELLRCPTPFTTRKFTVFQLKSMQFLLRHKAFTPPYLPTISLAFQPSSAPIRAHCCILTSFPSATGEDGHLGNWMGLWAS